MWVSLEDLRQDKNDRNAKKKESIETVLEADIVASFAHNRPIDVEKLRFERHTKDSRREVPVLTVKGEISDNVVEIGEEVNAINEGFDFAVAVVDKINGTTTYRPARFYNFESKYANEIESLTGAKKRAPPIDYDKDYDITADKWAEKRRQLTANFGSSKKIKMDLAAQRRTIQQDTLDEMRKTAFASNSTIKEEEEDYKIDKITMMKKATSSVLPPAKQADLSKDIYPISLFLSEEEIEAVADDAIELMKKKKKEKVEAGIPEAVILIMYNETTKERAASYLLLATMVEIIQKLGKSRSIMKKELNELKVPDLMRQKVQAEYFTNSEFDRGFGNRGAERIKLNVSEVDRLIAFTLALALTLAPEHKVPLTPFQAVFGIPPSKLEKLFVALGADLIRLDIDSAQRLKSLRAAVLLKPPSAELKGPRKFKRR